MDGVRRAISVITLGYLIPFVVPVAVVRNCPDQFRHSFPFVFATEGVFVAGTERTLVIGVILNTVVWSALLVGATMGAARLPGSVGAAVARSVGEAAVSAAIPLAVLAVTVAFLTVGRLDLGVDVWPGDVDTASCRHVTGHTVETNWWGPYRLALFDFDRLS